MPKVTLVEPQKKDPKRFNVFLDGIFAFGADEDLIVEYRLLVGKEIQEDQLEKILEEAELGKVMGKIYNLFSFRMRSEREVRDYFRIKNLEHTPLLRRPRIKAKAEYSSLVVEKIIEKLKRKGLLNDKLFAQNWVESRRRSKNKGKIAIKAELVKKGIEKEIINEVLEDAQDELELAVRALAKKSGVFLKYEGRELEQKALQFLVRRGFSFEIAKEAFKKMEKET